MIDKLLIAITHGLMLPAALRLLSRPDLDDDKAKAEPTVRPGWQSILKGRSGA